MRVNENIEYDEERYDPGENIIVDEEINLPFIGPIRSPFGRDDKSSNTEELLAKVLLAKAQDKGPNYTLIGVGLAVLGIGAYYFMNQPKTRQVTNIFSPRKR